MTFVDTYNSPLGTITLSSDGQKLTGLWLDGQKHALKGLEEKKLHRKQLDIFESTKKWLDVYFSGKEPDFLPPLNVQGTDFKKEVCDIMLTIPFGKTMTYGDIAKIIADNHGIKKMSPQAVGGAVGHNPISIIIPCHRVIGANGNLTGYGGGLDKKIWLLNNEGMTVKGNYVI